LTAYNTLSLHDALPILSAASWRSLTGVSSSSSVCRLGSPEPFGHTRCCAKQRPSVNIKRLTGWETRPSRLASPSSCWGLPTVLSHTGVANGLGQPPGHRSNSSGHRASGILHLDRTARGRPYVPARSLQNSHVRCWEYRWLSLRSGTRRPAIYADYLVTRHLAAIARL